MDRTFSSCPKSPFQNKGKLEVFDIKVLFHSHTAKMALGFLRKETLDELNLTVVSVSSLVSRGLSTGSEE